MFAKFAEQVYLKHPILFAFIIGCFVVVVVHIYSNFAQAGDVEKIEKNVKDLSVLIDKKFAQQELRDIKKDIFEIERRMAKGEATESEIDYLGDLKTKRDEIERKLDELADSKSK